MSRAQHNAAALMLKLAAEMVVVAHVLILVLLILQKLERILRPGEDLQGGQEDEEGYGASWGLQFRNMLAKVALNADRAPDNTYYSELIVTAIATTLGWLLLSCLVMGFGGGKRLRELKLASQIHAFASKGEFGGSQSSISDYLHHYHAHRLPAGSDLPQVREAVEGVAHREFFDLYKHTLCSPIQELDLSNKLRKFLRQQRISVSIEREGSLVQAVRFMGTLVPMLEPILIHNGDLVQFIGQVPRVALFLKEPSLVKVGFCPHHSFREGSLKSQRVRYAKLLRPGSFIPGLFELLHAKPSQLQLQVVTTQASAPSLFVRELNLRRLASDPRLDDFTQQLKEKSLLTYIDKLYLPIKRQFMRRKKLRKEATPATKEPNSP